VTGLPPGGQSTEPVFLQAREGAEEQRRFSVADVIVSDGRVVDVEVSEKIDHGLLRSLPM
jgi:hypothetical protein